MKIKIDLTPNGVLTYTYLHNYTKGRNIYEIYLVYMWMFACLCTYIRGLQGFFDLCDVSWCRCGVDEKVLLHLSTPTYEPGVHILGEWGGRLLRFARNDKSGR